MYTHIIFRSWRADSVKAAYAVRAARYGAMNDESCQPCNLTRVNKLWFYLKVTRNAYFFSIFHVRFIFIFSLPNALGLITFAFIS